MPDTAWKKLERRVAEAFGTTRTPFSGGMSGITRSDTLSQSCFVETKRATKYKAVITLWDKTKEMAIKERKTPVLALGSPNRPGFWLVVHVGDLERVYQAIKRGSPPDRGVE